MLLVQGLKFKVMVIMSNKEFRVIGSGRHVRLIDNNGWEYVERVNGYRVVCMVPVTDDNHIILVEQYRVPIRRVVIELPAGLVGDIPKQENEPLAQAAQRELVEETGYEAGEMIYLTEGPPSSGLSNEIITFFLAKGIKKVGPGGGDASENISVHEVPLSEAPCWIEKMCREKNMMADPKIYLGLYFAGMRR